MVNYYLQLFLQHSERLPVGIDEQFERAAAPAVDLARVRSGRHLRVVVLLPAPDPAKSAGGPGRTRSNPQPRFYQWKD